MDLKIHRQVIHEATRENEANTNGALWYKTALRKLNILENIYFQINLKFVFQFC